MARSTCSLVTPPMAHAGPRISDVIAAIIDGSNFVERDMEETSDAGPAVFGGIMIERFPSIVTSS
jgi:hypothetical protein